MTAERIRGYGSLGMSSLGRKLRAVLREPLGILPAD
jgi:hypothetical protein